VAKFSNSTASALSTLYDNWIARRNDDVDILAQELTSCIPECVDNISTTRTITRHTKPWFTSEISKRCKKLRILKKKCRYRKSPANVSYYKEFLSETVVLIKQAESNYWLTECAKLSQLDDQSMWKAIERLTNQHSASAVKPVRSQQQDEEVYLFNDSETVAEMDKHHVLVDDPEIQTDEVTFLQCY